MFAFKRMIVAMAILVCLLAYLWPVIWPTTVPTTTPDGEGMPGAVRVGSGSRPVETPMPAAARGVRSAAAPAPVLGAAHVLPPEQPASPQVVEVSGFCAYGSLNGAYTLDGMTAGGIPFYRHEVSPETGLTGYPYQGTGFARYLYHDDECGGKFVTGAGWFFDNERPDTTRTADLDNDGECTRYAQLLNTSNDLPMGTTSWRQYCGEAEGWSSADLTCSNPQPAEEGKGKGKGKGKGNGPPVPEAAPVQSNSQPEEDEWRAAKAQGDRLAVASASAGEWRALIAAEEGKGKGKGKAKGKGKGKNGPGPPVPEAAHVQSNPQPAEEGKGKGKGKGQSKGKGKNTNGPPVPEAAHVQSNSQPVRIPMPEAANVKAAAAPSRHGEQQFREGLQRHNDLRARHGAPPLEWSQECADQAQLAADACAERGELFHSHYQEFGHGQNAFWGTSGQFSADDAVQSWYDELTDPGYTWDAELSPDGCPGCGHFTQVVWKDAARVGMASDSSGNGFIVANYWPAGNMQGSYGQQVFPEGTAMQERLVVRTTPYAGPVAAEEGDDVRSVFVTLISSGQDAFVENIRTQVLDGWIATMNFEPNPGGSCSVSMEKGGASSSASCTF